MTRACFTLLFLPSLALATIFVQRPFQDEVKETPTIVRGAIGESYADWGSDGSSKRIYTYYRLQVNEVLKGDAESGLITIRELGGEKDGVGMQIAGAAHFSRGEDVVVFLGDKNPDGSYQVHGLSSGKFNLSRRSDGTECLSGIALAQAEPDGFVHPDGDAAGAGDVRCSWTLARLRQVVQEQGGEPSPPRTAVTPRVTPKVSVSKAPVFAHRAAPQLQPSASQEPGISGGGRLWIVIFAVGLAGLGLLLLKSRR